MYVTLSKYDILLQVGLVSLNLGICPHLTTLEIEAVQMTTLDLRGCGVLSQASIRCPHLSSLDASYCRQVYPCSASCDDLYVNLPIL